MKYKTFHLAFLSSSLVTALAFSQNKQTPKLNGVVVEVRDDAVANHEVNKQVPFLGVYAVPVNPAVSKQLNLEDGLYLSLEQVIPESPAAKSDLEQYDILIKFDDQILVNPEQLQALVRSKKKGDLVKLSILRRGEKKTVEVELDEQQVPDLAVRQVVPMPGVPHPDPADPRFGFGGQGFPFAPNDLPRRIDELNGDLDLQFGLGDDVRAQIQRQIRRHQKQLGQHGIRPGFDARDPELIEKYDADGDGKLSPMERDKARSEGALPGLQFNLDLNFDRGAPKIEDLLRDARRRGAASSWSSVSGSAQTKVVTMDETGSYQFSSNDGDKRFKATSPDGEVLFDGPVNTKEEKAKVPESLRRRLNSMESGVKVRIGSGDDALDQPQIKPRERNKKGKGKNQLL